MKLKTLTSLLLSFSIYTASADIANGPMADNESAMSPERKVAFAARIIDNFYIDEVDGEKLSKEAIVAMLNTLDPHSSYTDPKETADLTAPLDGNFSGIGIQFQMLRDTLYVIQTTAGGPSEKVGLRPGDRILSADGEAISGAKLSNSDITSRLRGEKGSIVNILVKRNGVSNPIEFTITRDDIPVNSIDASFMADDKTGYIKLSRFGNSSNEELISALVKLSQQGMKQLIIDLEDNGGGYLGSAVEIAGNFLDKGDLVTYTESPRTGMTTPFVLPSNGILRSIPLVVMVNQYSASASEILSGAIQDHDRGVIVGRRTFGKGLVQRPFSFPDGSMIRLTISRYHTPSGRSIQKPYQIGNQDDYRLDMFNRYEAGEFTSADAVQFPDSLKFTTLNRHRTVYGGGGIMPDRFVAIDTTLFTDYYRDLVAKSVINSYVLNYVDNNRDSLAAAFPTEETFVERFEVTPAMISAIVEQGKEAEVAENQEQLQQSMPMITTILKGLIGRDLFDMNTYYKVVQPALNPIYREALSLVNDRKLYDSLLKGS